MTRRRGKGMMYGKRTENRILLQSVISYSKNYNKYRYVKKCGGIE